MVGKQIKVVLSCLLFIVVSSGLKVAEAQYFTDVTTQKGIPTTYSSLQQLALTGQYGVGLGDFNLDGKMDFYSPRNGLYLQNNVGMFNQISAEESICPPYIAYLGDFNNDNKLDILTLRNIEGGGSTASVGNLMLQDDLAVRGRAFNTKEFPVSNIWFSLADLNSDGGLDAIGSKLEILKNTSINGSVELIPQGTVGGEQVTAAGQPITVDFDNDGDEDVFFDQGPGKNTLIFKNDGYGNFTKLTQSGFFKHADGSAWDDFGVNADFSGGSIFFDYNNDGYLDFLSVNTAGMGNSFKGLILMKNLTGLGFQDVSVETGINNFSGTWDDNYNGANYGDIDNDGDYDVILSTYFSQKGYLLLLANQLKETGSPYFVNKTEHLPVNQVSMAKITYSPLLWDYNNDGKLDITFTYGETFGVQPLNVVLQNNLPNIVNNKFINVDLSGVKSNTNKSAYGAKVAVSKLSGGQLLGFQEAGGQETNAAGTVLPLHFGLGQLPAQTPVSILINWSKDHASVIQTSTLNRTVKLPTQMVSPVAGTMLLNKSSVTFKWQDNASGAIVKNYWLYVFDGSSNLLFSGNMGKLTEKTITNVPVAGNKIYAHLATVVKEELIPSPAATPTGCYKEGLKTYCDRNSTEYYTYYTPEAKIVLKPYSTTVKFGQPVLLNVTVTNNSNYRWLKEGRNPVHCRVHAFDEFKKLLIWDVGVNGVGELPNDVLPGQAVTMSLSISTGVNGALKTSRKYIIGVDMVQENVTWFGNEVKTVPINVVP